MNKTMITGAAALTFLGGAALFSAPASAATITTTAYAGGTASAKLTEVGWRRYYRRHVVPPAYGYYGPDYYAPPAYYAPRAYYGPPPAYYEDYGPAVYEPELGVSVGVY
jgi:hypothetical protein